MRRRETKVKTSEPVSAEAEAAYITIPMLIQPPLRHLVETCVIPDTKRGLPIKCPDLLVSFRDFATILIVPDKCLKVGTILREKIFLYRAFVSCDPAFSCVPQRSRGR